MFEKVRIMRGIIIGAVLTIGALCLSVLAAFLIAFVRSR